MKQRVARYRVRETGVPQAIAAVRNFVSAIEEHEPRTRYSAYRLGDTLDFIHVMTFPDSDAQERHRQAHCTQEFVEALYPQSTVGPVFSDLVQIASTDPLA